MSRLSAHRPSSPVGSGPLRVVLVLGLLVGFPLGLLLTGAGSGSPSWAQPLPPGERPAIRPDVPPETLCDREDLPVAFELDRAAVDSIGRAFSERNRGVAMRADSLLRAGAFGDPGEDRSIDAARRYFQLHSWNAMKTISNLTELEGSVARMEGPGQFVPLIESYFNGAMYPLRHVERAQVGSGSFCLRYRIPEEYDETFLYGKEKVRVRTDKAKDPEGNEVRVLNRQWMAGDGSKLELLFESSFTGRIVRERIEDRGDLLDLLIFYDMEGLYVRKHGTHRMTAMITWKSVLEEDEIPAEPRIGAAAYFPGIDIELPWFLPDVGLDDLREFSYPPPLMASEFFLDPVRLPAWMGIEPSGRFGGWSSRGPRPKILDERFPDL